VEFRLEASEGGPHRCTIQRNHACRPTPPGGIVPAAIRTLVAALVLATASLAGAQTRIAPNGAWVGGTPQLAPNGAWVGGQPQLAPDGSWVGGQPRLAPDGSGHGDAD